VDLRDGDSVDVRGDGDCDGVASPYAKEEC
jgi:hypothetical protein